MGLATSQVRLLALTSRKADVEFKMQLASKHKTMLTREATQLSKLYYAKLNNAKIQYATENGYADVNYNYLMGYANSSFFDDVVNAGTTFDKKNVSTMVLTDNFGRVILDNDMMDIMLEVMNNADKYKLGATEEGGETTYDINNADVKSLTLAAIKVLLSDSEVIESKEGCITGKGIASSETAKTIANAFNILYNDKADSNNRKALDLLLLFGYQSEGTLYTENGNYYKNRKWDSAQSKYVADTSTQVTSGNVGSFYTIMSPSGSYKTQYREAMYISSFNSEGLANIDPQIAKQLVNIIDYYGSMFSAAFNGKGKTTDGNTTLNHYNATAKIKKDDFGHYVIDEDNGGNSVYNKVTDTDKLQDGLQSGIYQLINISSPITGGYSKGQDLAYFEAQNQVVEHINNGDRETITAWYNAERADLNSKESYWDSEVSDLSVELSAITTEIDSVKSLRKDAISSTFKWGGA